MRVLRFVGFFCILSLSFCLYHTAMIDVQKTPTKEINTINLRYAGIELAMLDQATLDFPS